MMRRGEDLRVADVIRDRRRTPRDDLTSLLVHAEVDGDRFDDDTLVHETLQLCAEALVPPTVPPAPPELPAPTPEPPAPPISTACA